MNMKKLTAIVLSLLLLTGCGAAPQAAAYKQISQEEAAQQMEDGGDILILDVRRPDEFAAGHIVGAVNIPNETIGTEEIPQLPDKDQTILVYCRSGNRSKQASQKLADLGYTDVREFGGISTWEGPIVTD